MKKIFLLIALFVFCHSTFAQTCPTGSNTVSTKNCYTQLQNFLARTTFQNSIVQKGSATDSLVMQFTAGRFLFNYGSQFLSFGTSQTNIGNTGAYSIGAGINNIDFHDPNDTITITFSDDTAHISGNHNIVAWDFEPKLDANSVTGFWGTTGNAGTVSAINFIGTTDNVNFNIKSGKNINVVTDNTFKIKDFSDNTLFSLDNGIKHLEIDCDSFNFNGSVGIGTGNEIVGDNKLTILGGLFDSATTTYGYAAMHVGAFNVGLPKEGIYITNGYTKLQLTYDEEQPNKTNWHWSLGSEKSKIEGDSIPTSGFAGTGEIRMKFTDGDSYYFDGSSLYSFSGIATLGNTDSHWAGLYTDGFKLTDGTQGAGKVLASDANGVGSWQYPYYTINATKSGDGVTDTVTIPHMLSFTPTYASAIPSSADARGLYYTTADATNIYLVYTAPPVLGTNNLTYKILATQ